MSGGRPRWATAGAIVAAIFLWTWYTTPIQAGGLSNLTTPVGYLLTLGAPPGLVLAFVGAFAGRHLWAHAVAWVATPAYGLWLGGLTAWLGTWSGRLFCEPPNPPCVTDWGPRAAAVGTAAAMLVVCALVEARLAARWSSGPS